MGMGRDKRDGGIVNISIRVGSIISVAKATRLGLISRVRTLVRDATLATSNLFLRQNKMYMYLINCF